MKLAAVALDYDGTITTGDRPDESVRKAITALRASGILVLLVTGRTLPDLIRAAGDLHFVDGVVAENGAVVYFSETGHTSTLAPPIPPVFLGELARRGIPFHAGQCLVDADANDGARILEVTRALELPLVLLYNRSRVMVLPQGVSKATGLHTTLDMLRVSARNTLAIGDAENDHELLRIAEVGAAVSWGSEALRTAADLIVKGAGTSAVADFLRPLAASRAIPVPVYARRRLRLGYTGDGREFSLAVRGRNILIAGDAKSGKSWVAGLLSEQLILYGYSLCVLDPEGDYVSLEALPGVAVLGGEDPPPTPRQLGRALRFPDRSVVIDLSRLPHDEKIEYIRAALPALNIMRRRNGLPHRILVDEAHYFLHDSDAESLLDFELNGYTVVTYCASRLPRELLAATEVMIVTCESSADEVDALCRCCARCGQVDGAVWRQQLGHLALGQAVALPITEEAGGDVRLFTIGPRLTPHVRHREKYVDVPVSEGRAFVFSEGPAAGRRARTLRQFVTVVEPATSAALHNHLRRGDFSRWIGDVFGDHALAAELRTHEERFRRGDDPEIVPEVVAAIRGRYDLTDDDHECPGAIEESLTVPEQQEIA
jgi:hydroxymethylpyrimidine pyrophosphatase-like HAD family hydrolase